MCLSHAKVVRLTSSPEWNTFGYVNIALQTSSLPQMEMAILESSPCIACVTPPSRLGVAKPNRYADTWIFNSVTFVSRTSLR